MCTLSLLLASFSLAALQTDPPPRQASLLLVLHKAGSSLGFYTPSGDLLATVPVGQHPHEMVLSPDGRYVYITDNGTMKIEEAGRGGNTVSIVDIAARKKAGEISLGEYHRPHGIDIDRRTGMLAVSTELPDRLVTIDSYHRAVLHNYDTKGKTSHMVVLGSGARWAWVSNSTSNNVSAVDLATSEVKLIPVGQRPEGSVRSRDGRHVYVCNRESAEISIIDTDSKSVVGKIATGKGPLRIALTPDGRRLVYACMHDRTVEVADIAAGKVTARVKLGGPPVSLSLSRNGRLAYASDQEADTVYVVSLAERKIVRRIKTAPGTGPDPVMEIPAR